MLKPDLPCPFHKSLHLECMHHTDRLSLPSALGSPDFPKKAVQVCLERKNWKVHFWTKSIFNSMPKNRIAQWRCQNEWHLKRNIKYTALGSLRRHFCQLYSFETCTYQIQVFFFLNSFIASSRPFCSCSFLPVVSRRKHNIILGVGGEAGSRDTNLG